MNHKIMAVIIASFLLLPTGGIYVKIQLLGDGNQNRPGSDILDRLRTINPLTQGDRTSLGSAWKERSQSLEHYRTIAKHHKEYVIDSLRGSNALVNGLCMIYQKCPFEKRI